MPTQSGTASFTIQVKDSSTTAQAASKAFTVTVSGAGVTPLSITTASLPNGQVGTAYSATLAASGGSTPYTWSITSGTLPAGLSLNASTGQISGTPTQSGTASFSIQVRDSSATPQTSGGGFTITVSAAGVTPLSITTTSLTNGRVGTAYSTTLAANGGTAPYFWYVTAGTLPAGLTLNVSTGQISGTPTQSGTGSFTIQVRDSSAILQTGSKAFTITVSAAGATPVSITTTSLPNGQVGTAYSAAVAASGGTTPYTWSVSLGTLPAGLTLNASTGQISGTPTQSGTASFTIQVRDSSATAQTASKAFTVTVSAAGPTPVSITTTSLPNGQVGTAYAATLAASGGTTPYAWSLTVGALPTGLSLNTSTGQISGTPTQTGTISFTVQVKDSSSSSQTTTKALSITVSVPTPVAISTTSLPNGRVSSAYTGTLVATGGATPYTWSITSGALPAGLSLNGTTGQITGTPSQTGLFSFSVQVKDSSSTPQTANHPFSVTIGAVSSGTPVTACGNLATTGATYVLQNDVSAANSCFGIQADGITLDLNGHVVTFATGATTQNHYGIAGMDCSNADADPSICANPPGQTYANFTLFSSVSGGTVVESTNGDSIGYMRGVRNGGQANDQCEGWVIHDITVKINQAGLTGGAAPLDSRAIDFDYCATTATVYNVTTDVGYGRVSNRYQILGPAIRMFPSTGGGNGTAPYSSPYCPGLPTSSTSYTPSQEICNNTINGGTQGGIGGKTDYRHIYNNTIGTNSSSTDDFAIYAWGQLGEIDHNTINNPSGRGIQIAGNAGNVGAGSANGWKIHDNNLTARMLPQWCADNGAAPCNSCEGSGLFGIEFKAGDYNNQISNNTFTVYANSCMATALRLTDTETNNVSSNNTYTALLEGLKCGAGAQQSPCYANAMSLNSGGYSTTGVGVASYAPVTMLNDTFIGDDNQVYVDYGGPLGALFKNCTFVKPATASAQHVFIRWGSYSTAAGLNIHFQDSIFQGGENPDTNVMQTSTPAGGGHPGEEYFIDWTYTLTVQNSTGSPLPGATVTIVDGSNAQVFAGATDVNGQISTVLNQTHWFSTSAAVVRQVNTPHTVSATGPSCTVAPFTLSIGQTTSQTVTCH